MTTLLERFRGHKNPEPEDFDFYQEVFGEPLDVDSLLSMRDMEDTWIELGHFGEQDRYPVPDYLKDEWERIVGVEEQRRAREVDTDLS